MMTNSPNLRERLNWFDRSEIMAHLADACVHCRDEDDTDELRDALAECIESGDIADPTEE